MYTKCSSLVYFTQIFRLARKAGVPKGQKSWLGLYRIALPRSKTIMDLLRYFLRSVGRRETVQPHITETEHTTVAVEESTNGSVLHIESKAKR